MGAPRDAAVSEMVGTILLTGVTVMLIGGFGAAVFSATGDAGVAPTGSFTLSPRPGDAHVDVAFLSGATLRLDGLRLVLMRNGTDAAESVAVLDEPGATTWRPGDTLRITLPVGDGALADGDVVRFLAVHVETGKLVGSASNTVIAGSGGLGILSGAPALGEPAFSETHMRADGATPVHVNVSVNHTLGLGFIESVSVDLTGVGGPSRVLLHDAGDHGDSRAHDGVYEGDITIPIRDWGSSTTNVQVEIPVTARDVWGRTATRVTSQATYIVPPSPDDQQKASAGATWVNLPSSGDVLAFNLSRIVFDPADLDYSRTAGDLIWMHISDNANRSRAWQVFVFFDRTSDPANGGKMPTIAKVEHVSWKTPTTVTYTPTTAFPVDNADAVIVLNEPAKSLNRDGVTQSWSVSADAATATLANYSSAEIPAANVGAVVHFTDANSVSYNSRGILYADFDWVAKDGTSSTTNAAPTASFTMAAAGGLAVSVDATATTDAEGDALAYSWNFGDGTTKTGVTATHTYATSGNRTVTLSVSDGKGGTDAATRGFHTTWFSCTGAAASPGTLTDCANLRSDSDANAAATLDEASVTGKFHATVELVGEGSGSLAATAHKLQVNARITTTSGGASEVLHVQALVGGTWQTVGSVSSGTFGLIEFDVTNAWNTGAPRIRFIDDTGLNGGNDNKQTQWAIDHVRVVSVS